MQAMPVDETVPRRIVALRGPNWPWEPADDMTIDTELENDLRIGIFPGAVAVHTRSLRMEGDTVWDVN